LIAGVPWAGVLALIVLVIGIAQVPALIVTLPAIGYIWWLGDYGKGEAIVYTLLIFLSGMTDNILKPLMLGRGVDAPMPVILIGALGGMATGGILGMFVGATLLALGYQLVHGLGRANRQAEVAAHEKETQRWTESQSRSHARPARARSFDRSPGSAERGSDQDHAEKLAACGRSPRTYIHSRHARPVPTIAVQAIAKTR
jgi:hypothetical protein